MGNGGLGVEEAQLQCDKMQKSKLDSHNENIRKLWDFYLDCAKPYAQLVKGMTWQIQNRKESVGVNLNVCEKDGKGVYQSQAAAHHSLGKLRKELAPQKLPFDWGRITYIIPFLDFPLKVQEKQKKILSRRGKIEQMAEIIKESHLCEKKNVFGFLVQGGGLEILTRVTDQILSIEKDANLQNYWQDYNQHLDVIVSYLKIPTDFPSGVFPSGMAVRVHKENFW